MYVFHALRVMLNWGCAQPIKGTTINGQRFRIIMFRYTRAMGPLDVRCSVGNSYRMVADTLFLFFVLILGFFLYVFRALCVMLLLIIMGPVLVSCVRVEGSLVF